MKFTYEKLGNLIVLSTKKKNTNASIKHLLGINIKKEFIDSVANINGTDLSKYQVITKNQFACNLMHVGRDKSIVVSKYDSDKEAIVSPSYKIFEVKNNNIINPDYLMLCFLNSEVDRIGWFYTDNSIRGTLDWSRFCQIKIPLPDIKTQNKIVKINNILLKRIRIKKELNQNLLKMSRFLYKEFYLNKAKTYNVKKYVTLDEVTSKFTTGLNPRKNFVLGEGDNYYVTIKNMANNSIVLDDKCASITDEALIKINKRSDLKVGDLLFSGIGTIGRVHLIDEKPTNWNISESVFTMRPNELVSSEFLFIMLLSQEIQEHAKTLVSGSVQKGVRMRDLKAFEFILPNEKDKSFLDSLFIPIVAHIKSNEKEIRELTKLRDTLLPKLMSGKIDVSKVNCD